MGPALTQMIGWCLCDNTPAIAPWASVDSDGVLGGSQVARCFATISTVTEKSLHRCTGVLARVHVRFCGERGVH